MSLLSHNNLNEHPSVFTTCHHQLSSTTSLSHQLNNKLKIFKNNLLQTSKHKNNIDSPIRLSTTSNSSINTTKNNINISHSSPVYPQLTYKTNKTNKYKKNSSIQFDTDSILVILDNSSNIHVWKDKAHFIQDSYQTIPPNTFSTSTVSGHSTFPSGKGTININELY